MLLVISALVCLRAALHLLVSTAARIAVMVAGATPATCNSAYSKRQLAWSGCLLLLLQVTRQVFEAAKGKLKVVGRAGVGVDNVDLAAATEVRPTAGTEDIGMQGRETGKGEHFVRSTGTLLWGKLVAACRLAQNMSNVTACD
jgi:hypothetical protein